MAGKIKEKTLNQLKLELDMYRKTVSNNMRILILREQKRLEDKIKKADQTVCPL